MGKGVPDNVQGPRGALTPEKLRCSEDGSFVLVRKEQRVLGVPESPSSVGLTCWGSSEGT